MEFETTRFGKITVKQDDVITLPDGPLGFPECTRFAFVDEQQAAPFRILQSLDNPAIDFVVVNPSLVRSGYRLNITLNELKQIGCEELTEDIVVYAVLTMAKEIKDITANLQGPILINMKDKIGCQVVFIDSDYTVAEKLV